MLVTKQLLLTSDVHSGFFSHYKDMDYKDYKDVCGSWASLSTESNNKQGDWE